MMNIIIGGASISGRMIFERAHQLLWLSSSGAIFSHLHIFAGAHFGVYLRDMCIELAYLNAPLSYCCDRYNIDCGSQCCWSPHRCQLNLLIPGRHTIIIFWLCSGDVIVADPRHPPPPPEVLADLPRCSSPPYNALAVTVPRQLYFPAISVIYLYMVHVLSPVPFKNACTLLAYLPLQFVPAKSWHISAASSGSGTVHRACMFQWWGRTCSQSCLGSGTSDLKSI